MFNLYGLAPDSERWQSLSFNVWEWAQLWEFLHDSCTVVQGDKYERGKYSSPAEGQKNLEFSREEAMAMAVQLKAVKAVAAVPPRALPPPDALSSIMRQLISLEEQGCTDVHVGGGFQSCPDFILALVKLCQFCLHCGGFVIGLSSDYIASHDVRCLFCGQRARYFWAGRPLCKEHDRSLDRCRNDGAESFAVDVDAGEMEK